MKKKNSSCPALCRASTSYFGVWAEDVDGRVKPGHDESERSSGLPISPRRRRLDDDRLAGVDHGRVAAFEFFDSAVLAAHGIFSRLTRLAARHPERRHDAVAGEQRAIHLFEEADGAADAVARVPFALAARALADVEILQHDRIAKFQDFR